MAPSSQVPHIDRFEYHPHIAYLGGMITRHVMEQSPNDFCQTFIIPCLPSATESTATPTPQRTITYQAVVKRMCRSEDQNGNYMWTWQNVHKGRVKGSRALTLTALLADLTGNSVEDVWEEIQRAVPRTISGEEGTRLYNKIEAGLTGRDASSAAHDDLPGLIRAGGSEDAANLASRFSTLSMSSSAKLRDVILKYIQRNKKVGFTDVCVHLLGHNLAGLSCSETEVQRILGGLQEEGRIEEVDSEVWRVV